MNHVAHAAELVALTIGLLLIAAGVLAATKRIHLPFTVALVLVGIAISQLAALGPHWVSELAELKISPEVILFVFLPTLIFESAYNMDARQLRRNLLPVLTLAVPGLLLSTAVIGGFLALVTPIDLPAALLLGAILSATDPVAVIALFKQLGAPKRLTILVEGESLFNDATALVLAKILIAVVAAGYFTWESALDGTLEFVRVFIGGVLVGWLAGLITGWLLGKVEGDAAIEISLTTILAYLSFMVAEEAFHVSGVMATVAAGITMGGWGRAKISPSVADYLEHFWEFMAYVANALIFLLVGLTVNMQALIGSLDILPWVIVAMLLSRGAVVYGLVPVTGKFSSPVSLPYQTVMFWGGLRGAIALAIVLSLEDFAHAELFVALVTGSVLFTLLVQGLSIEGLVKRLGLDRPPLADRLARTEGLLSAKQRALAQIPTLQQGGLFSQRVAQRMADQCNSEANELHLELDQLRGIELPPEVEQRLLFIRCMAEERAFYYALFTGGHLPENAYRDLTHSVDLQMDAVRQERPMPSFTLHPPTGGVIRRHLLPLLAPLPVIGTAAQRAGSRYIARDYEEAWGRHQGSSRILTRLETIAAEHHLSEMVTAEVRQHYSDWREAARQRLDNTAAQFPEFANAMQERLAGRLIVHTQEEVIESEARAGTIPSGLAESLIEELSHQIRHLRGSDITSLEVPPEELLRKVPFFRDTPDSESRRVAAKLKQHLVPDGEEIIRQGAKGDSLFLVARGVVRVSRSDDGASRDLATLMAGDFFGEMALLHQEPRSATCRAVSPCALYELKRSDFEEAAQSCPSMRHALEEADRKRKKEIVNG